MSTYTIYIGVDISKHHLDVYCSDTAQYTRYANTSTGIAAFLGMLDTATSLVVMEATGGYEKPLQRALQQAGQASALLNARKVRDYARASGVLAKTDKLDASVLADYAAKFQPRADEPLDDNQHRLKSLVKRQRQLARMITQEKNRLEHHDEPDLLGMIRDHIAELQAQYDHVRDLIVEAIAADEAVARRYDILKSCKGIGPFVAGVLIADMPELGERDNGTAKALAGLAPYNNDSGTKRGERHVCHGRAHVRQAMYQATRSACRFNPDIKAYYERKIAEGKPPKKARTACAAKLLTTLNSLLRDDRMWQP